MSNSRVDIIIPVYNVAPFLRRCLDSVRKQTYKHWRAICVDDGSTDGSAAILDEYAANDARFVVLHQENGGQSSARNKGIAMAEAEYVTFIDSDDFIHPQTLALSMKLIECDGSDLVSWYKDSLYRNIQLKLLRKCRMDTINARPWRIRMRYHTRMVRSYVTDDALKHISDWRHPKQKHSIKHCYVWCILVKRSLIKDIKFIEGIKYEDVPWWSELFLKPVKATITHLPLYYYYYNKRSTTKAIEDVSRLIFLLKGLYYAHELYERNGDEERMELWSHNLKWAILVRSVKTLRTMEGKSGVDVLKQDIVRLAKTTFFNDATTPDEIAAKDAFFAVAKQCEA